MASVVDIELEAVEMRLGCLACGTSGVITREAGDVMDRLHAFAGSHLAPTIVAIRFVGPLGEPIGWFEP